MDTYTTTDVLILSASSQSWWILAQTITLRAEALTRGAKAELLHLAHRMYRKRLNRAGVVVATFDEPTSMWETLRVPGLGQEGFLGGLE